MTIESSKVGSLTTIAMKKFGQRMKDAREELKFSQSVVSSSLGYSNDTYICNIEKGLRRLTHKKFYEVSLVLRIPISELINLSLDIDRAKYYDSLGSGRESA